MWICNHPPQTASRWCGACAAVAAPGVPLWRQLGSPGGHGEQVVTIWVTANVNSARVDRCEAHKNLIQMPIVCKGFLKSIFLAA